MNPRWRDEAGVLRTAGAAKLRTVDGTNADDLKVVDQIRLRTVDGTNPADMKTIYEQALRLVATPLYANGYGGPSGSVTTNTIMVGVAGGTPPYSHSWAVYGVAVADNPTSASTTFTANPSPGDSLEETAIDTVTDANGVVGTVEVLLFFQRYGGYY